MMQKQNWKDLTVPELAPIALGVITGIILFLTGEPILGMMSILAGFALRHTVTVLRLMSLLRNSVETTGVVVDYEVRTRHTRSRYRPSEEYQVYVPIVEYTTLDGVIRSCYRCETREHWFANEQAYPIAYAVEEPTLFCFTERPGELVRAASVYLIIYWVLTAFAGLMVVYTGMLMNLME